ncbi:iron-sulfur cluster co-chaperone protein HscB homolog isoform X1 [Silene latifolia]|uniref:iron-sulfur cluster co-chaperone protein HscB homolog isoform X1 n=1 Tax=Silene latifolia TaxID=37657 RepID=UPI003D782787
MKSLKLWRTILCTNHYHYHYHDHYHRLRFLPSLPQSLSYTSSIPHNLTNTSNPYFLLNSSFPQSFRFFSQTTSSGAINRSCWNCSSGPTSELFLLCDSCGCIQPIHHSHDYFRIFGLEKKFDIGEANLEGKYKDWQKKLHPDLVHSKSEREKEYAADQSSRVIDAYRTLNDSLLRAIYLMKLHGVYVGEEQTVSDPDLLDEIMELRESVEDATSSQVLKEIQNQVHEKMKEWTELFGRAYNRQDTEEALNAIRRITYYKRASEEIVKRL